MSRIPRNKPTPIPDLPIVADLARRSQVVGSPTVNSDLDSLQQGLRSINVLSSAVSQTAGIQISALRRARAEDRFTEQDKHRKAARERAAVMRQRSDIEYKRRSQEREKNRIVELAKDDANRLLPDQLLDLSRNPSGHGLTWDADPVKFILNFIQPAIDESLKTALGENPRPEDQEAFAEGWRDQALKYVRDVLVLQDNLAKVEDNNTIADYSSSFIAGEMTFDEALKGTTEDSINKDDPEHAARKFAGFIYNSVANAGLATSTNVLKNVPHIPGLDAERGLLEARIDRLLDERQNDKNLDYEKKFSDLANKYFNGDLTLKDFRKGIVEIENLGADSKTMLRLKRSAEGLIRGENKRAQKRYVDNAREQYLGDESRWGTFVRSAMDGSIPPLRRPPYIIGPDGKNQLVFRNPDGSTPTTEEGRDLEYQYGWNYLQTSSQAMPVPELMEIAGGFSREQIEEAKLLQMERIMVYPQNLAAQAIPMDAIGSEAQVKLDQYRKAAIEVAGIRYMKGTGWIPGNIRTGMHILSKSLNNPTLTEDEVRARGSSGRDPIVQEETDPVTGSSKVVGGLLTVAMKLDQAGLLGDILSKDDYEAYRAIMSLTNESDVSLPQLVAHVARNRDKVGATAPLSHTEKKLVEGYLKRYHPDDGAGRAHFMAVLGRQMNLLGGGFDTALSNTKDFSRKYMVDQGNGMSFDISGYARHINEDDVKNLRTWMVAMWLKDNTEAAEAFELGHENLYMHLGPSGQVFLTKDGHGTRVQGSPVVTIDDLVKTIQVRHQMQDEVRSGKAHDFDVKETEHYNRLQIRNAEAAKRRRLDEHEKALKAHSRAGLPMFNRPELPPAGEDETPVLKRIPTRKTDYKLDGNIDLGEFESPDGEELLKFVMSAGKRAEEERPALEKRQLDWLDARRTGAGGFKKAHFSGIR